MTDVRQQIAEIYDQVGAPEWAALNLDALVDVLRDLSWLPEGPVVVRLAPGSDAVVVAVLARVAGERAEGPRPLLIDAR